MLCCFHASNYVMVEFGLWFYFNDAFCSVLLYIPIFFLFIFLPLSTFYLVFIFIFIWLYLSCASCMGLMCRFSAPMDRPDLFVCVCVHFVACNWIWSAVCMYIMCLFSSNFIKIVIFDQNRERRAYDFSILSIPFVVPLWWCYFSSVAILLALLLF